jgi:hypothetical protein
LSSISRRKREFQAIDLVAAGRQGELGELQQRELAQSRRRDILKLNFREAVLSRRNLEALLNRRVHQGLSPITDVRPLNRHRPLDETQTNNARV